MRLSPSTPARAWLYALGVCAVVVLACMTWVDRPVADFVDDHLSFRGFAEVTRHALALRILVPMALLLWLGGAALWRRSGRPLEPWTRASGVALAGMAAALIAAVLLKGLFGRSDPDPLWVSRRIYGFHLLHGGRRYMAFPSGTTAIAAALLSVFAILLPPLRLTCALLLVLVSIALLITNSHWIADLVGGAFLGSFIGWAMVRRFAHAR